MEKGQLVNGSKYQKFTKKIVEKDGIQKDGIQSLD